ncbi:unnamed protein product [Citrullus colocynthis]|uniref:Uncharacterized protein n=1 Tax=Citrullus colocynthis TaxID=252529 RepID=A0ABP0Y1I5_9ROSI
MGRNNEGDDVFSLKGNIPKDTSHMTCPDGWLALKSTADGDIAMDRSLALALKLNTSLGYLNSDIVASGWYLPYKSNL